MGSRKCFRWILKYSLTSPLAKVHTHGKCIDFIIWRTIAVKPLSWLDTVSIHPAVRHRTVVTSVPMKLRFLLIPIIAFCPLWILLAAILKLSAGNLSAPSRFPLEILVKWLLEVFPIFWLQFCNFLPPLFNLFSPSEVLELPACPSLFPIVIFYLLPSWYIDFSSSFSSFSRLSRVFLRG